MENETIGQYELVRKLGEGGMAEVWEARHIHLHNRVALKFLMPRYAGDPELEERFLNEGKRQAQLQHPNIVSAIDFFQNEGHSYLAMHFVDGISLETRLQQQGGPLPLDEVHNISWDVLSALDYAHAHGVVHRDVKPSNILIDTTGRVFLMDFGIALAMTEERRVTRTGTAIGTPDYMSPEQILRPKQVDSRSDIYSFGCVLYAMLTGGPPFGADGATEFFIKDCHVRNAPDPIRERNPGLSPAVEQVVFTCMEKDPERRFQNGAAIMAAFDAALQAKPAGAPTAIPAPAAPLSFGAAAMAPAALAGREETVLEPLTSSKAGQPTMKPAATPIPTLAAVPAFASPPAFNSPPAAPPPPPPPPDKKKSRGWMIALAALLLVAIAAGAYFLRGGKNSSSEDGGSTSGNSDIALRLEGSTTVGDRLAPDLLLAFLRHEGAKDVSGPSKGKEKQQMVITATLAGESQPKTFSVVANGSGNAFTALASHSTDIGMASRPIKPAEAENLRKLNVGNMTSPQCETVVGMDGIGVIVNSQNLLDRMDRSKVAAIFRGQITNWAQVGGAPGAIHLYGRDSKSGTFDSFVALVLDGKKEPPPPGIQVKESGDEISKAIGLDPGGIGYVGIAQIGAGSKALAISDGPGTMPLIPTGFTVATEDYILSRRLFLYTPQDPSEMARRFVAFAASPEGQAVVKTVGYVEQTGDFERSAPMPLAAPAVYRQLTATRHRMRINFRFRSGSNLLDNKALQDIDRALSSLAKLGVRTVELFGFADSMGGNNMALSKERAQVVADQFVRRGVSAEVRPFSSLMPVGDNRTEEGRRKNRRVEVWAEVPDSALVR